MPYSGPQLTGEAISACRFVTIDASATPDTVIALTSDTGIMLGVTTQPLDSGQALAGIITPEDGFEVLIELATGVNPAASVNLTADTGGKAKVAASGDLVMAITREPASGSAGFARCTLVQSTVVIPA